MIDQPEEHCDLSPNNVCRHKTTLVPRLRPEPECVLVPQQVCHIKHINARVESVPFTTLWCQDEEELEAGADSLAQPPLAVTEPPVTQGYSYDVPANPLVLPPRTTTSLPVVEYDEAATEELIPADLYAAIREAIRRSIKVSLENALMLQKMTEDKQRLESGLRDKIEAAVREVVTQSIREQTASQQASSSTQLEATLRDALRQAVSRAVEERLRPGMVMNTVSRLEMEDIETGVREAVIEAIRQRLTGAVSATQPKSVSSVKAAVSESIRAVVSAALEARTRGMTEARRGIINTGIQRAVSNSLNRELVAARDGTSITDIKLAVEVGVMEAVRYALVLLFLIIYCFKIINIFKGCCEQSNISTDIH